MDYTLLALECYTPIIPFVDTESVQLRKKKLDRLLDTEFEFSSLKAKDIAGPLAMIIIGNAATRYGTLGHLGNFLLHTLRGQPQIAMKFLPTAFVPMQRRKDVQWARKSIRETFENKLGTLIGLCKNLDDIYFYTQMVCRYLALTPNAKQATESPYTLTNTETLVHYELLDALDALHVHMQDQEGDTESERAARLVKLYSLLATVADLWIEIHPVIFNKYQSYAPQLSIAVAHWYGLAKTQRNKTIVNKVVKELRAFFRAKMSQSQFKEVRVDGIPRLAVTDKTSRQLAAWQMLCREVRVVESQKTEQDTK